MGVSATRGAESVRTSPWTTPVGPPSRDEMWCVYEQRGCVEWLVHPEKGRELIASGITLDGVLCKVEKVCEWPHIGRWQVVARVPGSNSEWIDASRA